MLLAQITIFTKLFLRFLLSFLIWYYVVTKVIIFLYYRFYVVDNLHFSDLIKIDFRSQIQSFQLIIIPMAWYIRTVYFCHKLINLACICRVFFFNFLILVHQCHCLWNVEVTIQDISFYFSTHTREYSLYTMKDVLGIISIQLPDIEDSVSPYPLVTATKREIVGRM